MNAASTEHGLLVLKTDVFPDGECVEQAVAAYSERNPVQVLDLVPGDMNDADWDHVLDLILSANLIITV